MSKANKFVKLANKTRKIMESEGKMNTTDLSDENQTPARASSDALELREAIHKLIDDFFEPDRKEKYINDLEDAILTEVAAHTERAVYGFHEYIMGKNLIQPETDQAYNYGRLHHAIDDYIETLRSKKK